MKERSRISWRRRKKAIQRSRDENLVAAVNAAMTDRIRKDFGPTAEFVRFGGIDEAGRAIVWYRP